MTPQDSLYSSGIAEAVVVHQTAPTSQVPLNGFGPIGGHSLGVGVERNLVGILGSHLFECPKKGGNLAEPLVVGDGLEGRVQPRELPLDISRRHCPGALGDGDNFLVIEDVEILTQVRHVLPPLVIGGGRVDEVEEVALHRLRRERAELSMS